MPSNQQVVRSEGYCHGIPTYPETAEFQNLTAIVTGANGKKRITTITTKSNPARAEYVSVVKANCNEQESPVTTWSKF